MTNHDPKNKECPQYGQSEKHLETCNLSCTCSRQGEDANGAPKEKQDWEERFDEFWKIGNMGYNSIGKNSTKDFIRTLLQEAKEEGRRESEVYCACGDMLEKDWLGFGGRVCASCEPIEREKIAEQARHAVIAEVEKWGWKNITDKLDWANLRAFLASLKTNSK